MNSKAEAKLMDEIDEHFAESEVAALARPTRQTEIASGFPWDSGDWVVSNNQGHAVIAKKEVVQQVLIKRYGERAGRSIPGHLTLLEALDQLNTGMYEHWSINDPLTLNCLVVREGQWDVPMLRVIAMSEGEQAALLDLQNLHGRRTD